MEHKYILLLGAGRSSSTLINYLLQQADHNNWTVTVGDISEQLARERTSGFASGRAIEFNIEDRERSRKAIQAADMVISLLPAHLHPLAAAICLEERKHFFTASYVSDDMRSFDSEARAKDLLFLIPARTTKKYLELLPNASDAETVRQAIRDGACPP